MQYKCQRCEDTGHVAGDPKETMSWREVERRKTLSRALRVWAEHMPKAGCPECGGEFKAAPVPEDPPARRPYEKKSPRWNKKS